MLLGDQEVTPDFREQLIAALRDPEVVNILHQYSDYDTIPDGLHHQLGIRHDQSSYGDHKHDGKDSSGVAQLISGTTTATWDGTNLKVNGKIVGVENTYTPTFYDAVGVPALFSSGNFAGEYSKTGKQVSGEAIIVTGAGAFTAGAIFVDLPVAIGAAWQVVGIWFASHGVAGLVINTSVNTTKSQLVTTGAGGAYAGVGFTPAAGETISVSFNYLANV